MHEKLSHESYYMNQARNGMNHSKHWDLPWGKSGHTMGRIGSNQGTQWYRSVVLNPNPHSSAPLEGVCLRLRLRAGQSGCGRGVQYAPVQHQRPPWHLCACGVQSYHVYTRYTKKVQ